MKLSRTEPHKFETSWLHSSITDRSIIEKLTEQHPKDGAPILDIIESAKEKGIDETQTEHMIKKMSENGEIYQPSAGHYKLLKGR